MDPLRVVGVKRKKKTLTGVLKRLSIAELETLNAVEAKKLKEAVEEVLVAKKILHKVREKYESL